MPAEDEQLAVIVNPQLGYDADLDGLAMRFSAYISEGQAACQSINGPTLMDAFRLTRAPNVEWFNGKACWVKVDANERSIIYLRMFKPA